jgi:hypothetical protein
MSSTKAKISMEKKLFQINALLLSNYKNHLEAKKNEQRKWTQNGLSNLLLFGLPNHAFTQGYVFTRD